MTPFQLVASAQATTVARKPELVLRSRQLERAALLDPPPAVAATLQDVRYLTPHTREVYTALAGAGATARLYARGLQSWLGPGVVGIALDEDDPLADEWVVVLASPRAPVVFAATDLGDGVEDSRCFRYAVSHDPDVVLACGSRLGLDLPGR